MKRFYAAVLGLIAGGMIAWADIPDFDSDEFRRVRRAYQYQAVAVDSVLADKAVADSVVVDEYFKPPSVSALPGCNADTEPAILFDESDNLWKGCSDQSGTFEWTPLGRDRDQDGFRDDIDGSPETAATGYDTPVAYQVTTTYSGTDAQVTIGGNTGYTNTSNNNRYGCAAYVLCRVKGDLSVSSYTTGARTLVPILRLDTGSGTCDSSNNLSGFLADGDDAASGNFFSNASLTVVTGATCIDTRDT